MEASPGGDIRVQLLLLFRFDFAPAEWHDDDVFERRIPAEFFQCFDTLAERACMSGVTESGEELNIYDPCELRACWVPEYLS